jgi:hypothetical protein
METVNYVSPLLHLAALLAFEATHPALDSVRLLPTASQCRLALQMNGESRTNLNAQRMLYQHRRDLDELYEDAMMRFRVWDLAADCHNEYIPDWRRRAYLKRLSDMLWWSNECDMIQKPLPWPVPGMGN